MKVIPPKGPDYIMVTPRSQKDLIKERNRYKRALRRIAKGYILHNGLREEYTPHFCRTVALKALNTKTRNRR